MGASRLIQNGQHGGEERPPVPCRGGFVRPNHPPDEFESSRRYYPHDQRTSGFYTGGSNKVRRSQTKPCRDPYRFRPIHAKLLPPRPPVIQPAAEKRNVQSDSITHEPNSLSTSLSSPRVCAGPLRMQASEAVSAVSRSGTHTDFVDLACQNLFKYHIPSKTNAQMRVCGSRVVLSLGAPTLCARCLRPNLG